MNNARWVRHLAVGLLLCCPVTASAQRVGVRDADVDELIDHLVTILRDRQGGFAEIHITGYITLLATGESVHVGRSYRGTVIDRSGQSITFKTTEGMRFEVPTENVTRLDEPGHFIGEKTALQSHGGRTALATLAVVSAGSGVHDPTVRTALQYLKTHPMPGTYGRALRASLYSLLIQQSTNQQEREELFKLLRRDARWLVLAMNESDGYTYTTHVDREEASDWTQYDNSNSQFGNLGVWIAALAGYNVPKAYWSRVEQFWLKQQHEDGGWSYRATGPSTQNMTIAGINSLIIVLDQLYARTAGRYVRLKGIKKTSRAQEDIRRLRASVDRGIRWLSIHGKPYGEPYTQLGHERLGLASGEKYFGTYDWYRAGAQGALRRSGWERMPIENISMWLLFLSYGRAPVLVNKLEWGDPESGWDYYYRDMYHACRYLSNTFEQLYKWQIIDTKATLYDLQDAPLLYVSGHTRFWMPERLADLIKQYVNAGGTVIGHANRCNREFAQTFKQTFENMFTEWGTEFRKLPPDHALYSTASGAGDGGSGARVPMWGLSDGYREAIILLPSDVAGAWHQSLVEKHDDLFRLFADLRYYAAPRYRNLPGRLRVERAAGAQAEALGRLRIARAVTGADRGGAPTVWQEMDKLMMRYYGVSLLVERQATLSSINEGIPYDIVHVAGQGVYRFSPPELHAIKTFCRQGGLMLIEALGGDRDFARAVTEQLKGLLPSPPERMDQHDAVIRGDFPRGKPLQQLVYTAEARLHSPREAHPTLYHVEMDGRTVLVFSALDLSVSANGHYVKGLRGYDQRSAQKILRNLLLYRVAQKLPE